MAFGSRRTTETPYSAASVERQIGNAERRIRSAGFKPESSERNWFEKLTNLPKNQNAFLDILELLNRPTQGVMNIAYNYDTPGANPATEFLHGLTGKDRVSGVDVARKAGVQNRVGQFALGTALEVVLDPLNFIPAGAIGKLGGKVGRGAGKALDVVSDTVPFVRRGREIIEPAVTATKEALGKVFVPQYGWERTLTGETDETLKKGFLQSRRATRVQTEKALAGVADIAKQTGVEAGEDVGRVMEAPLKRSNPFVNSKVSEPVYHGSGASNIEEFFTLPEEVGTNTGAKTASLGAFFSENPDIAKTAAYGFSPFGAFDETRDMTLYATHINLEKPLNINKMSQTELTSLEKIFPGITKVYRGAEDPFEVVQFIAKSSPAKPHPDVPNFATYAKQKGMSEDEMRKAWNDNNNPIYRGWKQEQDDNLLAISSRDGQNKLKKLGYDGIVVKTMMDSGDKLGPQKQFIVFDKKNIKVIGRQSVIEENVDKLLKPKIETTDREIKIGSTVKAKDRDNFGKVVGYNKETNKYTVKFRSKEGATATKTFSIDEIESPNKITPINRELSTDPSVQKAARDLARNNELIRQWALDNGVNVGELEGYMTHILSSEERKLRGKASIRGASGAGTPNKKILNARKLQGSAEEVNEQLGKKLFEPNAYFATAIGQKRLIEYVNAVKFRREVLSNPKFAVPFTKGDIIPAGAVKINSAEYKFIKDATLDNLDLVDEIGGEYIVTKGAKEALDRYKKLTTDEGVNAFLKVFDSAQSVWKRAVLFSIPYHLRNDMGAKFNNWVAGMNAVDLLKYSAAADDEVYNAIIKNNPSSLYKEYIEQGLGASSLSKIEFKPYGEPEEAIKKTVALRSKTTAGQVKERLNPLRAFETSREFGDFVDQTNRFALYKWAKEAKKLSPEQARELVNRVQFDYTNLTTAEQEIFTRTFPFYRWMRNNIPYQLRQFVNDPKKYMRVNKIRLNAQEAAGIDEKNMPEWMREQFAIAVSGDKKGSGKFLSMSLPLADLLKVTQPLKTAIDATTPLVKTPAELALNRNFFFNKPIEKFRGQEKQFQVPGTDLEFGIPAKAAYLGEQVTGQIGRGFSQYLQKESDQDIKFRMPSMGISSLLKEYDVKKARYFEALNELQALQDQMKYIEQQTGQKPKTIRELNK